MSKLIEKQERREIFNELYKKYKYFIATLID